MTSVVICGAGFAGLRAALDVRKKNRNASITVIDPSDKHVFIPSLYKVAAGWTNPKAICIGLAEYLKKKHIGFENAAVTEINPKQNIVLIGRRRIRYDYLVVALGSQTNYYGVPGADRYVYRLRWLDDAIKIRNRLEELTCRPEFSVVVVGGGHTGTELTGQIADLYANAKIALVDPAPVLMPMSPSKAGRSAMQAFAHKGVKLMLGAKVVQVTPSSVKLADKTKIESDIVIWTGGVTINKLIEKSGLAFNSNGIIVNQWLQAPFHPHIFIVGDSASIKIGKRTVPKNAHNAIRQGASAAANVTALIRRRPPIQYRYNEFPTIVAYGRRSAMFMTKSILIRGVFVYWLKKSIEMWYVLRLRLIG